MKNNTTNTLTIKIWKYFVCFAISIFIILWLMQVIFLQSYYSTMKKIEIENIGNEIESIYKIDDNYETNIDKIALKNFSNVYIIDLDGNLNYSSFGNNMFSNSKLQIMSRNINIDIEEVIKKVKESGNKKVKETLKVDRLKSEFFVYAKLINNDSEIMIIATSIDPIDATISVLKNQLMYITIIALVISSIISIFISKRISKPIKNIKYNAEKLALGNYDVTFKGAGYEEIDELANTLNYMAGELKKTDKVRKELIANVSHDLRTPLTMIKAYSEMIRDLSGDNKEKRKEHLQVIMDETDRLINLVNDMMNLSKIESGKLELNIQNINYTDLVKSMIKRIKNLNNDKFNIELDIPDNLFSNIDKIQIEQVLYNLITNAIKHAGDDKDIKIKVSVTDKKIKTEVIDNGVGISKEDIPHIFDRYYKSDKLYKRETEGSGLGLSIVKNILIAHNVDFGVKSKIGEGSNFWYELNIQKQSKV